MIGSTSMVFTRTCDSSRLLASTLRNFGLKVISINGHMSQHKRLEALKEYKSGKCNIVLCTDVLSRGLDIESVDMVINYDIPTDPKIYIHRVGRTARAGRTGVAISLLNQYELLWFRQIEEQMDKKLPLYPALCDDVMLLKERVDTAKRLAEKEIKESGEKKKWRGEEELGEEDEDIDKYLGLFSSRKKMFSDIKDKRSSKKFRR